MAAVLAGAVHAPLTAIMLLFEMTNDYRIILPLMFAVAVSLPLSQWIRRDSVYTLGLTRKGIRIERGRDVEVLESLRVDEVMQTEVVTAQENDTLAAVIATIRRGTQVLVPNGSTVLQAGDVLAAVGNEKGVGVLRSLCT
jgi:CIC family chloride channel protein